jgi:hypothetical protein
VGEFRSHPQAGPGLPSPNSEFGGACYGCRDRTNSPRIRVQVHGESAAAGRVNPAPQAGIRGVRRAHDNCLNRTERPRSRVR